MKSSPVNTQESISKRSPEQQLNRACEACRTSKVRCLPLPGSSSQCQRCSKARRQCVFVAPAKRRQRKRTDVRVTELEREVKQLTSLLRPNAPVISPVAETNVSEDSMSDDVEHTEPEDKSTLSSSTSRKDSDAAPNWNQWTGEVRSAPLPNMCPDPKSQPSQPAASSSSQDLLQPTDKDILDRGVITEELAEELLQIWRDELVQDFPSIIIPSDW